ncbi:outer membrane protein assembly factor BamA [Candidatus Dependentiae bacterium]|nr:outer membrane protein assembly factor BamA [Candidatus Dependentiae bacterium]
MIHENKKRLVNSLFLTFAFCFLFNATTKGNAVLNKKSENESANHSSKDSTHSSIQENNQSKIIETSSLPQKIDYEKRQAIHNEKLHIKNIHVQGNEIISKNSIIQRLPLKVDDIFNLNYTASMIKNLYKTGFFQQVKIVVEPLNEKELDLYIIVQEKPRLKDVTFKGNKTLSAKELKEELKISSIPTLVKEELTALSSKIKKMYQKKNYHQIEVSGEIIPIEKGIVSAEFTIKEGKKSYLTHISFKGNKKVSSKKLRRIIISKEDWLLGMLDHSGSYNPEMVEGDKYMIEDAYKSNGFVHAQVVKVDTNRDQKTGNYHLTYHIQEGDQYKIKSIEAQGNDVLSQDQLKAVIPLYPGQLYSQEKARVAIDNLKLLWGEYGYIFADIDPIITIDDENKTVSITFHTDLKSQVYLNRLTIKGNQKTKDNVIRRGILLDEGELITNRKMDESKARTNLLNYFDPKNGVNWKTTRIDDSHADLDLILKEIKTGHFQFNLGYGGSPSNRQSPQTGINFNCNAGDRNVAGSGIALSASAEISKRYRAFNANLVNPWLFDKPIKGAITGFARQSEYDNVEIAENPPFETSVGLNASVGYVTPKLNGFLIEGVLSFEKIGYENKVEASRRLGKRKVLAQTILDQNFIAGNQISLICNLSQDKRNGIVFATRGHQWNWTNQFTFPGSEHLSKKELPCDPEPQFFNSRFQYYRSELDVSWYTPLIGEYDLVLCVHGNAGFLYRFKNKQIPWRSLYHVGGPTTIRGYLYGQVGPTWEETSLGATRAFNVNVEFIAPLSSNLNTRLVLFYDGGAGWKTPYLDNIIKTNPAYCNEIKNNNFFYRHTVGVGVRIKSPSPLQVDFGIKLNPSKKFRKELTQLHFNVEHAF